MKCELCGVNISATDPTIFQKVETWRSVLSDEDMAPEYIDEYACGSCVPGDVPSTLPSQPTLFDLDDAVKALQDDEVTDYAEWRKGYDAGWRNDELIVAASRRHQDFASGYETGRLNRIQSDEALAVLKGAEGGPAQSA